MFKKCLAIIVTAIMTIGLVACGAEKGETMEGELVSPDDSSAAVVEDIKAVKEKGKLVVGITDFEPMDFKDEHGDWIGFDAEMAQAFASESLGVDVEFVEIEWDNKALELSSGNIDCVWNGMTLTDEVKSAMDCSNPYCNNAQIVIVPKDKADKYQDVESLKDLNFAVEVGSAGEEQAKENGLNYTAVQNQANALMEVAAGTSDAAIIDSLMAAAMVGEGTSYSDLTYTVKLNSEEYGVGFRKGSDLTEELNKFFKKFYDEGKMQLTADVYGVSAALIEQK